MKIDDLLNIDYFNENVGVVPLCWKCTDSCTTGCSNGQCTTCSDNCSSGCSNSSCSSGCSDSCISLCAGGKVINCDVACTIMSLLDIAKS